MNREHTPGPWYVRNCDDSSSMNMTVISASDKYKEVSHDWYKEEADTVCIVFHQLHPQVSCEKEDFGDGDAKLIAAAPDLLDACIYAIEAYEGDGLENMDVRDQMIYKLCKAAVEKAV